MWCLPMHCCPGFIIIIIITIVVVIIVVVVVVVIIIITTNLGLSASWRFLNYLIPFVSDRAK